MLALDQVCTGKTNGVDHGIRSLPRAVLRDFRGPLFGITNNISTNYRKRHQKRGADAPPFFHPPTKLLEVSGATGMAAVAVKLDCVASSFATGAAIVAVICRGAPARRVLTGLWFVCHSSS